MTTITIEYFQIVKNREEMPLTVKGGETMSNRRGKFLRVDSTTGKGMLGNATSTGELGNVHGIALTNEKYVGDSITLFRDGLLDWGDALDGMAYGAPIYVSDIDGTFADSVGSNSLVAGYVVPVFEIDGTVKKLADIKLR